MTPNPTSPADPLGPRVVLITLDNHVAGVVARARDALRADLPGLTLTLHASTDFSRDEAALARAKADIATADILIVTMMFIDDHIQAILPALAARRADCAAMVCAMSAGEIIRLTKLGALSMDGQQKGPMALLKKLRGSKQTASSGAGQMAMLRRLPKLLRFIPGPAQDLRAYFLTLQYWLSGSDDNIANLVRMLVDRYASGVKRGALKVAPPQDYAETGVYHPRLVAAGGLPISEKIADLPAGPANPIGTVGLLILRSYVLSRDAGHYDGVIAAMEAQGLRVIPAFANGLDARPAIEEFFIANGRPTIDALVSLTGFSLVGGPAYNDAHAAEEMLAGLDVPYLAAHPIEFQTLEQWGASGAGLTPIEQTIMVAIPELEGATAPTVFGGRSSGCGEPCAGCERHCTFPAAAQAQMRACIDRCEALAERTARLVRLRRKRASERRLAIVLFNFPPNAGAAGSAAFLGVFESLLETLRALQARGYRVTPPASVDDLRGRLLSGNAARYNTDANVAAVIGADALVRQEPHLGDIEKVWGAAPGRQLSDGRSVFILGAHFGEVFVGLQPGMGVEGDPMRLMFEQGLAPTHAFSAFYRYIRDDFGADAVLHFGTHGALEFMPGKHAGLSGACWPDRLLGALPNFYLYAANNPSEGALARRRSAATLISYLTPPLAQAGLHRALDDLKHSIDRWRALAPDAPERDSFIDTLLDQARSLDLIEEGAGADALTGLSERIYEVESALIPTGLHVLGRAMSPSERRDVLAAIVAAQDGPPPADAALDALITGADAKAALTFSGLGAEALPRITELHTLNAHLSEDKELDALMSALAGGYIRPAPGGDLLRNPAILPTGRNIHGFDPFRIPSAFAVKQGAAQAEQVLARAEADAGQLPESVALVLWGTDNLKLEGGPIAQALALMGARPRLDSYGRVAGAELIPLSALGRPRVDVVITLSGIFRDLLPLQTKMLAEAAFLAASADEPDTDNFIRKHALTVAAEHGVSLETAALRVFCNADGAYGANVNQLIDSGAWEAGDDLADAFETRKCFAYGRTGAPRAEKALFARVLADVDCAYQNLDCVELGVTAIDHYVDTLGGVSRAIARAKGRPAAVYIADQTQGPAKVRSLAEQVTLDAHTRTLNPRWFESLLKHGYEGVRQIEAQVTNTMGWSATTGDVAPWIYQKISETYVLDDAMRDRLATLNPKASARLANRLIEAQQRQFWSPDEATLAALRRAGADLEDRLEGVDLTMA
jgi:magnesium chelatase subunit H